MRKHLISDKKAIELSINFIVMLILAIVGFGLGMMFLPKLFEASKDVNAELDSNSKEYLMNMAMEGKVAAYPENFETKSGTGRVVGLGIMNVGETQKFTAGIKVVSAKDNSDNDITVQIKNQITEWVMVENLDIGDSGWHQYHIQNFEVKRNDRYIENIFFRAPKGTMKGKYTFAVLIKRDIHDDGFNVDDENYAGSKLVTVTVV